MKIVKDEVINEIIIEKSRFITYLKRVDNIDEANDYLAQIKKKHYDATHHCSALIIDEVMRSNDNGEPNGTAGVRGTQSPVARRARPRFRSTTPAVRRTMSR